LRHVDDGFRAERMERPHERDGERERPCHVVGHSEVGEAERPSHDRRQRGGGEHVEQQVDEMVAGGIELPEAVVQGEGQVRERTPRGRRERRRAERARRLGAADRRPEPSDRRVVDDGDAVVEDERGVDGAGVDAPDQDREDDERAQRAPSLARRIAGGGSKRPVREARAHSVGRCNPDVAPVKRTRTRPRGGTIASLRALRRAATSSRHADQALAFSSRPRRPAA
jgi:hypothetical protein